MPAKKAPSANDTSNSWRRRRRRRARSPARRGGTARASRCGRRSAASSGMTRLPTISISATKAATLAERDARIGQRPRCGDARRPRSPSDDAGERRQQHEREDHREVLDDQPADGDAAALGLDQAALLQRAQQHDRAGDRQREAEHEARADRPAEHPGRGAMPSTVALAICTSAPGMAIARTDSRSSQREVQADAEHQQDDADLGEVLGHAPGRPR